MHQQKNSGAFACVCVCVHASAKTEVSRPTVLVDSAIFKDI